MDLNLLFQRFLGQHQFLIFCCLLRRSKHFAFGKANIPRVGNGVNKFGSDSRQLASLLKARLQKREIGWKFWGVASFQQINSLYLAMFFRPPGHWAVEVPRPFGRRCPNMPHTIAFHEPPARLEDSKKLRRLAALFGGTPQKKYTVVDIRV